ncbi:MAG: patatin-like phospholipase family protein [Luteococcus sp.]|uniref:patatin-like phospholipase family protein n=1 Tax=Luteococcus sp. TaxID=1969402 RepID=UPI0026499209|nr:patatin-like phospholipase family protein [Luteococcus sp.]MDN5563032.1 patatin-like phospholipase family protein [Luteococcus sp.]
MARRTWLGIGASLRLGREERQGLVLSGGGSKASFQLGALAYLYEVVGIEPQVIVGTSAGSILGAMLAQSADREQQVAALRDLDALWLDMTQQSDMFTERTWFRRFRSRGQDLVQLLNRDTRSGWLSGGLHRIQLPFAKAAESPGSPDEPGSPAEAQEELTGQMETLAMATLDPTAEGPELTPSQVMAILAGLSRMRGMGNDLGVIMSGAEKTRSMYIPGPLLRALLGEGALFDSSRVTSSGMTVRIAMVSLESGELRFMREDGRLVDRDDVELPGEQHDFSRGVLASCSIPTVFTPVPMDGEHFVDGGVRENLPAEMAIGPLGCTTTYVVTSNAPGVRASGSFEGKDMFQIMLRSTEIQSDETERDEVAYAKLAGAVVIEPEFDVHEALVVDPGLIRINRDYGWIRAAEQHLGATVAEQALDRSIIAARRRIWELEKNHLDPAVPHDERELLLLARLKYDLRDQVPRLRPELLPEGADQWWQRWEAHPVAPQVDPPWLV